MFLWSQEVLLNHQEVIKDIKINQNGQIQLLSDTSIFTYLNRQEVSKVLSFDQPCERFLPLSSDTFALISLNQIRVVAKDRILFSDTFPELITTSIQYQDTLIIATGQGLYVLDGDYNRSSFKGMEDKYINDLDIRGYNLLVALDDGIGKINLKNNEITFHQLDKIVNHVATLHNGYTILLTAEDEILWMNQELDIVKQMVFSPGEIREISHSLGEAFIATSTGCFKVTDTPEIHSLVRGSVDQVLACSNTLLLVQGRDLIKWNITSEEVLTNNAIFSLYAEENSLWTGTKGEIQEYQNDQIIRSIKIPVGTKEVFVSSIVTDEANLYAGTMGSGLFIFDKDGNLKKQIYHPDKKNRNNIIQIKKLNGDIWIAYLNGMYMIDSSNFGIKKDYGDILEKNYIYCFEPIDEEEFYVGTSSRGVLRYHEGERSGFLEGTSVYSLSILPGKTLIAGTEKQGTWAIRNDQPYLIHETPGIISIGTISGIMLLATRTEVMAIPDDPVSHVSSHRIDYRNGNDIFSFPINTLENGHLNSITQNDQQLFIGFENGYLKINKERLPALFENKIHPIKPLLFNQQIESGLSNFKYHDNSLSFRYHNQSYNQITPTIFKYRLRGLDDNWQLTQQKMINYYNLPPGKYAFQVANGFNSDFVPDDIESYDFTIHKPFWKKPIFISAVILAAIILLLYLIKKREQLILRKEKRGQEKVKFELQQLKNQIDPHFLFNSLNSLIGQIEDNPQAASRSLQDMSDLYRNILKYEKLELMSIREDVILGQKYFDIHKVRFENLIELHIDVIENPTGMVLPMTTQFLIENAIKHNIINKNNPLFISIGVCEHYLKISNTYHPKTSILKGRRGIGLKNLKSRYRFYTDEEIVVNHTEEIFSVKIPIIHV